MKTNDIRLIGMALFAMLLLALGGCSSDDSPTNPNDPNNPGNPSNTVTDIDGNVYQTVTIGNQVWMAENLKVTHYRNGDPIPHVSDNSWDSQDSGAYCNYSNDPNNGDRMGRLYNVYAALDSRNIAPEGWHVASDSEWQALISYLGGDHVAGGKMKEAGTVNWSTPNTGATNESGFSALPTGSRVQAGPNNGYILIGYETFFWTSTLDSSYRFGYWYPDYYYRFLTHDSKSIYGVITTYQETNGYAIRCVKD